MSTITASLPPSPVPAAPAGPAVATRAAARGATGAGEPPSNDITQEDAATGAVTGDDRADQTPSTSRTAKTNGSRAARRDVNQGQDDALSTPEGGNFATLLATFLPADQAPTMINSTETAAQRGAAGSTGSAPLAASGSVEPSEDAGVIAANVPSGLAEVRASLPTAIAGSPLAARQGRTLAATSAASSTETSPTGADAPTLSTLTTTTTDSGADASPSVAVATSAVTISADATQGRTGALAAADATVAATSASSAPVAMTERRDDTGDRTTRSGQDVSGSVADASAAADDAAERAAARTAPGAETAGARSTTPGAGDEIRAAAHEIVGDARIDREVGTRADDLPPQASAVAEAVVARAHAVDSDASATSDAASVANAPAPTPVSAPVTGDSPVEGRPAESLDGDDGDDDTNATSITDGAATPPEAAPTRPTRPAHAASERSSTGDDAPSTVPLMATTGAATSHRSAGADSDQRQEQGPAPTAGVATAARVAERSVTESKAAAPAAAPVPTPASLVNDQLVSAARRFKDRDGTHRLHLDLHPAELGAVTIDVTVEGATVHLHMSAERASTSELLRSALDELRASLNDGGFTAGQLDVGQRGSGRQQQASAFERLVPDAARREHAANANTAVARATTRRTPSDGSRLDLQL